MTIPFIRKLEYGAPLTAADKQELNSACENIHLVKARTDLIVEGAEPKYVHLVMEGFACRYKTLPNGKRQIMAYFLPGDFCDLHVKILGQMDHTLATLAASKVAKLSPATIDRLTMNPRINIALWWSTLVDQGTLREWLVNMGQRPAEQQLGHLICEIQARLHAVGCTQGESFELPVTQGELADTLGLTSVHVNRTLTLLRNQNLIKTQGRRISIPDLPKLREFSDFDPNYLHLHDNTAGRKAAERATFQP